MPRQIETLTLNDARQLIAAGEAKAEQIGVPYNMAVVDAGGNLVAHVRMDGAWIGSIDIAINKAFTARAFDMSTEKLGGMAQSGKPLFGIHTTNDGDVVVFGGGAPIMRDGTVIGAVGASGGTVDQDVEVLHATVSAFEAEKAS
ncbi:GlcG/HbpS family heme-binding protein [Stakelama saccharophila]|uniref:Heme-binding protein n=1 Tax=Stakelama saccharophila TaxID=3075605 RepID=A0ABZ0B7X9_9SPHN|nr:heme-binding protein [Stakelama sp. W311]WNO52706.1 heme-binding protein [Stakelama sp. W311]